MDEGRTKRLEYAGIIIYTSLVLTYAFINLLNRHVWNIAFNPIDSLLKPFMVFPIMLIFLFVLIQWTTYTWIQWKKLYLLIKSNKLAQQVVMSFLVAFGAYNSMNFYFLNTGLNPVDTIIKPFMLLPLFFLAIALLYKGTSSLCYQFKSWIHIFCNQWVYSPGPNLVEDNGSIRNKYFFENIGREKPLNDSIKDDIDVVKLLYNGNQVNIPSIMERANLLMKDTSLKDKAIRGSPRNLIKPITPMLKKRLYLQLYFVKLEWRR